MPAVDGGHAQGEGAGTLRQDAPRRDAEGEGAQTAPAPDVSVRKGEAHDAVFAAGLHASQIADGFLSSLGPRFLAPLYRRITRTDGSFLLIAEAHGHAVGFIAGSVAVGQLYRQFLLRDGIVAVASAPLRLAASWRRVFETLGHGQSDDAPVGGELLAIAVDPSWRSKHIGLALVHAFTAELERMGQTRAHVVVGADNDAAISLYHRCGFVSGKQFELHPGTTSLLLTAALPHPTGSRPSTPA